jgi:hypothetical protein
MGTLSSNMPPLSNFPTQYIYIFVFCFKLKAFLSLTLSWNNFKHLENKSASDIRLPEDGLKKKLGL